MSGNSSAIYVLDELHCNNDARPPARTHAIEAAHADLFVFLYRCASRASLGGGGRGGKQISAGFLGQFFKKNWAKSYQIST
jgi:hypothetical protein